MISVHETLRRCTIKALMIGAVVIEAFNWQMFNQRTTLMMMILGVILLTTNDLLTHQYAMDEALWDRTHTRPK